MDRTTEIVLGTIGITLQIVFTLFYYVSFGGILSEQSFGGGILLTGGLIDLFAFVFMAFIFLFQLSYIFIVVSFILGLLATIFVKKRSTLSGILFLVGGLIGFMSIIPSILFITAGFMALIRKAPSRSIQAAK